MKTIEKVVVKDFAPERSDVLWIDNSNQSVLEPKVYQNGLWKNITPDISGKENISNKVTSISSESTDTQYPSAKAVYNIIGDIESLLAEI